MRDHRWPNRQNPDPAAPVENPIRGTTVATRYAVARPDLHGLVIELLARRVPKPGRALDLGAGTGLSTRALRGFAEIVVGVDSSADMLRARSESLGSYVLAAAELLPFRSAASVRHRRRRLPGTPRLTLRGRGAPSLFAPKSVSVSQRGSVRAVVRNRHRFLALLMNRSSWPQSRLSAAWDLGPVPL